MKFMATRNGLPLSRLICWGVEEDASHFISAFGQKSVIHSNLLGVHIDYLPYIMKGSTVTKAVEIPLKLEYEDEVWEAILNAAYKKWYDVFGLFYFGWAVLKKKLLGTPLPAKNAWAKDGSFLCTGVASVMPPWLVGELKEASAEMMTPLQMVTLIEERYKAGLLNDYLGAA